VIRKNLTHLPDDLSLFRDLQSIITKAEDDFKLLVESRIAEQKRKEEEAAIRAAAEVTAAEDRGRDQALKAKEEAEAQQIIEKANALANAFSDARIPATEPPKQEIKSIEKPVMVYSEFDKWWFKIGSGIIPEENEEHELFARRVALSAWDYSQSLKQDSAA
jgi:hypothetical protein